MEIKCEELVGCWKCIPGEGYFELREDGTAVAKYVGRGSSGDFGGEIRWDFVYPTSFKITFIPTGGEVSHAVYQVVRHDDREMQLDVTLFSSFAPQGMSTGFQFWKRSKRPASWGR
jgi:hypothetical protein